MATKKQKRAAALAKREKFMEELTRTGLAAQKKDREERKQELLKAQEGPHQKHGKFEDWCLHCQHIKKNLARGIDLRPKKEPKVNKSMRRRTDAQKTLNEEIPDEASLEMECV